MEHVSPVRALAVSSAAASPEAPFSLEDAPAFQAFVAEMQRLARVRPAPGLATVADIPLLPILERSLWAVMARIAQKAGIGYMNEAGLIDAAAPRATRLLAVALPFAYATPTAAAEAFLAAMPPAPSRPSERGEPWLQAAAQAAVAFFAAHLREVSETGKRFQALSVELAHKNRIPLGRFGAMVSASTFGLIPHNVLMVIAYAGGADEPQFSAPVPSWGTVGLSRLPWRSIRRWTDTDRQVADIEADLKAAGAAILETVADLPKDILVPVDDLASGWIRTQVLLAAFNAPADRVWIESPELAHALALAVVKGPKKLESAFRRRIRRLVRPEFVEAFLSRFQDTVTFHVNGVIHWGGKADVSQSDLDALLIRVLGSRSPSIIRDRLKDIDGRDESGIDPTEAFHAFDWTRATAEDFRLASSSLREDPSKLAAAYFALPPKHRQDRSMQVVVEQALASDPDAYADAARRCWVPLTWPAFEKISSGLPPHEALAILGRFLTEQVDLGPREHRDVQGLFLALLRRTEPDAFQKLAWEPKVRDAVRCAIRRDILDIGAVTGAHIAVEPAVFRAVLRTFGPTLWAHFVLSEEISHRDAVLLDTFSGELSKDRPFEPWPRMEWIWRGDEEVESAKLNQLLDVDDAKRLEILADLTEQKMLRWIFEGEPGAKRAMVEYQQNVAKYFAARGLTPDGKPLAARSARSAAPVPVERKARPSGALPSRSPRKR